MEEAWTILEYLPKSFKSEKDQEYINFLWDTFQTNYDAGKYQFAYLAYHMLFMSYIYFIIWKIKSNKPEDFQKAIIGFQDETEKILDNATTPFVFHRINERTIFRFLKLIGCVKDEIGNYTKMVDDRNEIAHSNGNIFYSAQETLDNKISLLLKLVDEIQNHSSSVITSCFESFLIENYEPETREYPDALDQINEVLIQKNYFSEKDIGICSEYNIADLEDSVDYEQIKELYDSFFQGYGIIGSTGGDLE